MCIHCDNASLERVSLDQLSRRQVSGSCLQIMFSGTVCIDCWRGWRFLKHIIAAFHMNSAVVVVLDIFKNEQCWEGYFENVIGYRLQVTLLKM